MNTTKTELDMSLVIELGTCMALLADELEAEFDDTPLETMLDWLDSFNMTHVLEGRELLKAYYVKSGDDHRAILITPNSFIEAFVYDQGVPRIMYTSYPMFMDEATFESFESYKVKHSEDYPENAVFNIVGWQPDYIHWRTDDGISLFVNREYTSLFTELEVCIQTD